MSVLCILLYGKRQSYARKHLHQLAVGPFQLNWYLEGGAAAHWQQEKNHVRKQCCSVCGVCVCGVDVAGRRIGRLANCCCEVGSHYKWSSPTFLSSVCTEHAKIDPLSRGGLMFCRRLRSFTLICIICKHCSAVCPSLQPERKKWKEEEKKRWKDEKKWTPRKDREGKGGEDAICSHFPRVLRSWLMTSAAVCPLGDGEKEVNSSLDTFWWHITISSRPFSVYKSFETLDWLNVFKGQLWTPWCPKYHPQLCYSGKGAGVLQSSYHRDWSIHYLTRWLSSNVEVGLLNFKK